MHTFTYAPPCTNCTNCGNFFRENVEGGPLAVVVAHGLYRSTLCHACAGRLYVQPLCVVCPNCGEEHNGTHFADYVCLPCQEGR